ncbi:zf-HC2 domain-containing protein [Luteococcus sp. H138]|uniref:anti-sigma factor family protein n=1 Tax=unclassified Luteococcus TaxID=2639923 RepID=UPI00313BBBD4
MAITCEHCHDELTAYADQALPVERRDEVAAHLVDCRDCRRELVEINQLRTLLTSCAADSAPAAPCHLADRLVAIAGAEADRQLWLSPERSGCLPSPRRRRRIRVAALGSMTTAGVVGAFGGAWLMAPQLPTVDDPDAGSVALSGNPTGLLGRAAASTSRVSSAGQASMSQPVVSSAPVADDDEDCPRSFSCPDELTGLPRVDLDVTGAPDKVRSIYASAEGSVLVVQHRGRLSGHPDGADDQFRQAWQSGETVYCVLASDRAMGEAAVAALPHEQAVTGEGMERVRMGLRALAGQRGR